MDNTPEAGLRAGSKRAPLEPNNCGKHLPWDNLFIIAIIGRIRKRHTKRTGFRGETENSALS